MVGFNVLLVSGACRGMQGYFLWPKCLVVAYMPGLILSAFISNVKTGFQFYAGR